VKIINGMTLGSLFDGISGFPLAASWAGIETKWISEIDKTCLEISKRNFPKAEQYGDIKEVGTGRTWQPKYVDILTGGDPCQPSSVAGLQLGTEDPRYLWPEKYRIIKELQPIWIVNENVSGTISNGILDQKISDLEDQGYTCWPAIVIPASAVGADHERNRVWLVAYSERSRLQRHNTKREDLCLYERETQPEYSYQDVFNGGNKLKGYSKYIRSNDGLSRRVDKLRVKAMGNAIVPQIAYEIFKEIIRLECSK
jgi:DNA (cytosine-5)-methyltransferase 1